MPFGTDIILTYDDNSRIDDVMEFIIGLTPTKTPLFSSLKKEKAKDVVHHWQEQSLTTQQDNAVIEGAAFGSPQHDQPGRVQNLTQIFEKVYEVSSSDQWVDQYGIENQYVKQEMDSLKKIATDIELAIVRGSLSSGTGSAARRMGGFENFITSVATTVNSGVKLTESAFNDFLQAIYDNGGEVDEVYTNSSLKRIISAFNGGATPEKDMKDRRVSNIVTMYESDFGTQTIFISRYVGKTANSDSTVLFVDTSKNYLAVGEPVHVLSDEEVAQTKHGKMGVIRGELTLAPQAEKHQAVAKGFSHDFN